MRLPHAVAVLGLAWLTFASCASPDQPGLPCTSPDAFACYESDAIVCGSDLKWFVKATCPNGLACAILDPGGVSCCPSPDSQGPCPNI